MALEIGAWFRKLFGNVEEPKQEEGRRVGGEMTAKEAGELASAGLSGVGPEFTDGFNRSNKPKEPQQKQEESFWDRPIGKAVMIGGSILAGAAAGIALIGGWPGALVGGVAVGLLGLASCTKQPDPITINDETHVEQNVNVTVDMSDLLAAIQELKQAIQEGNTNLQAILDRLIAIQNKLDQLSDNQSLLLNAVTTLIVNGDTHFDGLMAALNAILAKLDQMDDNNAANFTAILNAINGMNAQMQVQFGDILAQLMTMDEHQQEGIAAILAAIAQLDANQQQNAANIMEQLLQNNDLLQQILNKMDQMDAHQQAGFQQILAQLMGMGGDIQALLNAMNQNNTLLNEILGKIDQLNANMQAGIAQILAKLDQMDQNQQQGILNILNMLTQMDQHQQEGVQNIIEILQGLNGQFLGMFAELFAHLDHIEANQLTQIQQLAEILAAIQAGNVQLDNIATLIQNLDLGTDVNLDVIESLLEQILAQEQQNGNVLNNIEQNQTLIINTINSLRAQITQIQQQFNDFANENLNYLLQILNRIPTDIAGCNCDCEMIIQLLELIVECLQNPDWNHEGIINEGDWGDLLG